MILIIPCYLFYAEYNTEQSLYRKKFKLFFTFKLVFHQQPKWSARVINSNAFFAAFTQFVQQERIGYILWFRYYSLLLNFVAAVYTDSPIRVREPFTFINFSGDTHSLRTKRIDNIINELIPGLQQDLQKYLSMYNHYI